MSKIRIYGDTSGYVDIAVPAVATNTTLNLDKIPQADISGNIAMDTDTLYVDSSNDRIGINTSSPSAVLDVNSSVNGIQAHFGTSSNRELIISSIAANGYDDALTKFHKNSTAGEFAFSNHGSERLRIDQSGKVGIGTTDPSSKLHVLGSASEHGLSIKSGGGSGISPFRVTWSGGTEGSMFIIDDRGNVGIGGEPNEIQNNFKTLQIGGNLTLNVDSTGVGAGVYMGNNVYRDVTDSRWEYIYTDEASQYVQAGGEHTFRQASSGTANNPITWTTALKILSSGYVGIGTASPDTKLHTYSSSGNTYAKLESNANNSRSALLPWAKKSNGSTIRGYIGVTGDANKMEIVTSTNDSIHFYTNNDPTNKGIFLQNDAKVGINKTSSLVAPLNIQADADARSIRIVGRSDDYGEMDFFENDNSTILSRIQAHNTMFNIRAYNIPMQFQQSGNTKMTLDADGDVGIGTTPYANSKLTIGGTDASGYSSVLMFDNNNSSGAEFFILATDTNWTAGANKFIMGHGAPSSANVDMTIDGAGKVGIGTYNPTGKLHVYDSGVMDMNLVGNPPELNLEDISSSSGSKRIRLTVDTGKMSIQGLSDDDQSVTYTFLEGDLSNGNLYLDNINGHQLSHRNLINNGGMQIAQRNASYTITTSGYQYNCLDRWGNYYAGTSVGQQEQTVFNQLKKVMRITATSSTSNLYTFQWIENGGKILCNGERFSISFKARSSVASGKTCTVQMRYGNAGAGNTAQSDTIGSVALTNSFQQFKFENVDASSFNYTQAGLWLWMPGPSIGDYFEITDVQVELGSKATKFEQKSIAQEMNDCMRFYQRLQGNRDGSGGAAGDRGIFHMHNWGSTNWYGIHHFNVAMRTGPTLKTGFSGTYLGTWFSGGNTGNATSIQIQNSNSWRAELSGNHDNGSFLQGGSCWLRLGADDNYVAFDAEHL